MRALVALAVAAAAVAPACGPDANTFAIHLALSQGEEFHCPSPTCAGIAVSCESKVSIRIVDAADPSTVYLSRCLLLAEATNLCAVSSLDLTGGAGMTAPAVPNRMVRIEVLIWPRVDLTDDQCPTNVEFDSRGMPVAIDPAPAVGGQKYFLAGSSDIAEVELGCLDAGALNDLTCRMPGTTRVRAVVDDFDTRLSLPGTIADNISVAAGVPVARTNPDTQLIEWSLDTAQRDLDRTLAEPVPGWQKDLDLGGAATACVQTLEKGTQQTPAIACHAISPADREIDLRGFRLAKSALNGVIGVLRLPGVPDNGIVVGIVVDHLGRAVAGATVLPSKGSIRYLNGDRTALTEDTVTSSSGVFVSQDVPFDATWIATDTQGLAPSETPIGGLLVGAATVIVIQLQPPPGLP